jgi:hypothetical protein
MREHPMLAIFTVAQLIKAGVVHVMVEVDAMTGAPDYRLSMIGR